MSLGAFAFVLTVSGVAVGVVLVVLLFVLLVVPVGWVTHPAMQKVRARAQNAPAKREKLIMLSCSYQIPKSLRRTNFRATLYAQAVCKKCS
jgi:hypothetical protein